MSDIRVVYEVLDGGSQGLHAGERALLERMESLRAALHQVAEGWQGEAHRAFQANMRAFDEELNKLAIVLNQTGDAVGQAGQNYRSVDLRTAGRLGA